MSERGTFVCDICGISEPHSHTAWEIEQERFARPAFEKLVGDKHRRAIGPYSEYGTMLDIKLPDKWRWFANGWYAKWSYKP